MFDNLREDLRRYGSSRVKRLKNVAVSPGAWAVISYRLARWVHTSRLPRPVKFPIKLFAIALQTLVIILTNIQLPETADIGRGLLIVHTGYIVLAEHVVMGRHCTLAQGVTIGHAAGSGRSLAAHPVIGDRVYIGPGAAVIGDITVGNDVLIGVNAVVTRSTPDRAVLAGNPARVLSRQGSFQIISYPGMDSDPDRIASLAAAAGETRAHQGSGAN